MNGSNNSSTFINTGTSGAGVTPYVNAKISTAQSVSGGSSGYFDGSSYLRVANGSWAAYQGVAVKVELDFYAISVPTSGEEFVGLISKDNYGICFGWGILLYSSKISVLANDTTWSLDCSVSVTANAWHHLIVESSASGGTTVTLDNAVISPANSVRFTNCNADITVGCLSYNNPSYFFNGYIDNVSITRI